jgi:hypothetical protein
VAYSDVFGGQTIYPANLTFLALETAVSIDLWWPIAAQPNAEVVADIIMVNATAAGVNLRMPDARSGSEGVAVLFHNVGAETFEVQDLNGNAIISVASGEAWEVYLSDNTTEDGVWQTFQFGAGASSANAAALAGAGLKAILTTLNVKVEPNSTNISPVTPDSDDRAEVFRWTGGVGALSLPDPAVVGSDWFMYFRNGGTGSVTATPAAGLINGTASIIFRPGDSALIYSDGSNYFTIGFGQSLAALFDFISINVGGTGAYALSAGELNRITYRLTGTLTGNREIEVPNEVQQYWIDNQTNGAFSLTVKTAGSGVVVPQGESKIVYCDGLDVIDATRYIFPFGVPRGGTGLSTVAQGDLLYASATDTLSRLAKSATATRYLANTGASNNPSWDLVNLANGVTGRLAAFSSLPQGSALSVLGVAGNSVANLASIVASIDNQVLRRSGSTLAFGAINLASGSAVTGTLAVGNGGLGLTAAAQGDVLYASAANTWARLAKVTPTPATAVRALFGTAASNNPEWIAPRFGTNTTIDANSNLSASLAWMALRHTSGTHTWTIPENAFALGDAIFISNEGGSITIAPDMGVTLIGAGGSGSITIAAGYMGFLVQVAANIWSLLTDTPASSVGSMYGVTWDGTTARGDWPVTPGGSGVYTITHNLGLSSVWDLAITAGLFANTAGADSAIHVISQGANSFNIERSDNDTFQNGPFYIIARRVA